MSKLLLIIFILTSVSTFSVDTVRCQGKLYSLDYLIGLEDGQIDSSTVNSLEVDPGPGGLYAVSSIILYKLLTEDVIASRYNNYMNDFFDMDGQVQWQESELDFEFKNRKKLIELLPKKCRADNNLRLYKSVSKQKIGNMILYEYSRGLFDEIKKSSVQYSFLIQTIFLKDFLVDLKKRSLVNMYLHQYLFSEAGLPQILEARRELSDLGLNIQSQQNENVCLYSSFMREVFENRLVLPCEEIIKPDFDDIISLEIDLSNEVGFSFGENDFSQLDNLEKLKVTGLLNFSPMATISISNLLGLKNLTHLDLSYTDLNYISSNFKQTITGLELLDLSHCSFSEFRKKTFANLVKHESRTSRNVVVDLSYNTNLNQGTTIHSNAFENFGDVTELNLSHMKLRSLPRGLFRTMGNIKKLDLSANPIRKISHLFDDTLMNNLEYLNLSYMHFKSLSDVNFKNLSSLRELVLEGVRLREIPSSVLNIPQLRKLTLCGAYLSPIDLQKFKIELEQEHSINVSLCNSL